MTVNNRSGASQRLDPATTLHRRQCRGCVCVCVCESSNPAFFGIRVFEEISDGVMAGIGGACPDSE